MQIIFTVLLLLLSTSVFAELYVYENEYIGINTGITSKESVVLSKGEPNRKSKNSNNIKFHYEGFQVTFQDKTGKVNSIIIFDPNYLDPNGIKVGYSKVVLEAVLKSKVKDNYLVDPDKGIIYWFKEGEVSKIVLAHELLIND
jgi:hypothetical protein